MVQDEIKTMLTVLMENKKAFKKFYKTGHFSYDKDELFKGEVAIINDKAVISFLQDMNDETKIVATANFQDSGTFILKLFGENFSQYKSNLRNAYTSRMHKAKRDEIIDDIASIRKHCAEAEEKSKSMQNQSIRSKFDEILKHSDDKISKKAVLLLLEDTINKLNKTRNLDERNKISPKIAVSPTSIDDTSNDYPNYEKIR